MPQSMPSRSVAVLAFPGVQLLDVIGPLDVFAEANRQLGSPGYAMRVIGLEDGPIAGSSGVRLLPDSSIADDDGTADVLLVAGSPDIQRIAADERLQAWLRHAFTRSRRRGSVCSGAFALAASGLLDGRQATTHWNVAAELARLYPRIDVDADPIFVRDGDIYTSAGVTAGMDLALALVEEDHGRELALAVARELVMFVKRPGGQTQFSAHLAAQLADRSAIQRVQAEVLADLAGDHSVDRLAAHAGMSTRNFARAFRHETGMTPGDFVEVARVEAARRLLEESSTPLQRVASRSGFGTVTTMRRAFARRLGVTPADYRKRFKTADS